MIYNKIKDQNTNIDKRKRAEHCSICMSDYVNSKSGYIRLE